MCIRHTCDSPAVSNVSPWTHNGVVVSRCTKFCSRNSKSNYVDRYKRYFCEGIEFMSKYHIKYNFYLQCNSYQSFSGLVGFKLTPKSLESPHQRKHYSNHWLTCLSMAPPYVVSRSWDDVVALPKLVPGWPKAPRRISTMSWIKATLWRPEALLKKNHIEVFAAWSCSAWVVPSAWRGDYDVRLPPHVQVQVTWNGFHWCERSRKTCVATGGARCLASKIVSATHCSHSITVSTLLSLFSLQSRSTVTLSASLPFGDSIVASFTAWSATVESYKGQVQALRPSIGPCRTPWSFTWSWLVPKDSTFPES